jgi:ApbE superfamily uncharacterized protein (UPF0280 family)
MASKSRRVASRQSQLNRRRKRQQRGPSGIPAGAAETDSAATSADTGALDDAAATAVAESSPSAGARPITPPQSAQIPNPPRSHTRIRDERPTAYQYMGPEIRRIMVMAGTAFAVLVVLKIVL